MKISLKWLNKYIDLQDYFSTPEKLEDVLTAAGLEVENLENYAEKFRQVVVAQVVELEKHPDADKLTVCKVDCGEGELRQIICGAKNHKQGDKVVAALPGAVLPGDFAIKKSKIRGVESLGMLCSESELGMANESEGITILPKEAPVGKAFADYQGLNDIVFELSVTPNRADCLSHIGLARELGCLLNRKVKLPEQSFKANGAPTKDLMALEVLNKDLCPRYAGRAIRGVKVGASPVWLKNSLESVGLNSINNIVDVTNYVMLEYGQPLHAFDSKHITGAKIIVDLAREGEKFTTLDGTEIELQGDELSIRDQEKPVALAGVIGGQNSGVTESTQDIFLESAYFPMGIIRRTARKFGLDTDSAYRFSRGTDPANVVNTMNRACQLIQEVAGGEIANDFHDFYPQPIQREEIKISKKILEERLGYSVEMGEFVDWMTRLGCVVTESAAADEFKVKAPSFRWDLFYAIDLIEEYARLHGYDKIPEVMPKLEEEPSSHAKNYLNENFLVNAVANQGYLQAVNYNFISEKFQKDFLGLHAEEKSLGVKTIGEPIIIANPLSEDLNSMRRSLLPGLFKNLMHNYRHGSYYGRIFELGPVFSKSGEGFCQNTNLSLIAWGQRNLLWNKDNDRPVIYDLKSCVENIFSQNLHSSSYQWRSLAPQNTPQFLHPGQCATLFYEGRVVGFLGTLHPSLKQEYKLRHDVAICDIDVDKIMRGQPRVQKIKSLSKYPAVERDFSFVVPDSLAVADVIKQIEKVGGNLLQKVEVFDVYKGDRIEENVRSVAFRLTYQDHSGTLEEERLTQLQSDIINKVSTQLNIAVR